MSSFHENNPYQAVYANSPLVAAADEWERAVFIRRTYAHLSAAIAGFAAIEWIMFSLVPLDAQENVLRMLAASPWNWLIVLGAFMVVSWLAHSWASSANSLTTQYLGLGLYVIAQAVIFMPLIFIGTKVPGAIPAAAMITGIVFGGLTMYVFATKSDFSGLGKYLALAGLVALGFIAYSALFGGGFGLGAGFSAIMVLIAGGYILYDTSNVLHHYRTTQYVAAALALFSSVAILFWYVLRIVISMSGRD